MHLFQLQLKSSPPPRLPSSERLETTINHTSTVQESSNRFQRKEAVGQSPSSPPPASGKYSLLQFAMNNFRNNSEWVMIFYLYISSSSSSSSSTIASDGKLALTMANSLLSFVTLTTACTSNPVHSLIFLSHVFLLLPIHVYFIGIVICIIIYLYTTNQTTIIYFVTFVTEWSPRLGGALRGGSLIVTRYEYHDW